MNAPAWSLNRLGVKRWIVSGFGMGYMPVASGTFGSAAAMGLSLAAWGAVYLAGASLGLLDGIWLLGALVASFLCVRWAPWAIAYYAARSRKAGDPGVVVLDEFAGQWVALLFMPLGGLHRTLLIFAVQFFLFRIFDVLKPPPARQFERLPAGWGILCDDLAAGAYANLIGQVLFRFVL